MKARGQVRDVWIDAICLDQGNAIEKATQVPLIGKIYGNAAHTLVWLGDEADTSTLGMKNLNSPARALSDLNTRKFIIDVLDIRRSLHTEDLPQHDALVWLSLRELLSRPWFFMLWTLQETVLCRDSIILCGNESNPCGDLAILTD